MSEIETHEDGTLTIEKGRGYLIGGHWSVEVGDAFDSDGELYLGIVQRQDEKEQWVSGWLTKREAKALRKHLKKVLRDS